ncbi:folylpolyglutamate synthase/dihydrofolate synthase family protein [Mariniluteicoccus endophyticus]
MTTNHDRLVTELTARWPENRVAPSLDRMQAIMDLLGEPQRSYPVIHVAGTNGKGSTAIMIEALLRSTGLRTGRYSSPHLVDITERIAIDGRPISQERFGEVWADIEPYVTMVDGMDLPAGDGEPGCPMTFFEVLTAMAYAAFADAPVDVAVVETGLGGTWDATNVADGEVAVVMPIGLDHTHLLGSTLTKIAGEKAGIIKPGAIAVLSGQEPEAAQVLLARCAEVGALPMREGVDFGLLERQRAVGGQLLRLNAAEGPIGDIHLPLHGAHMARNAGVALAAVEAFLGGKGLSGEVVVDGFAEVRAPGRLESVRQSPPVVLDGAHNVPATLVTAEAVTEAYGFDPMVGVVAMMADKDVEGVLKVWEEHMTVIVCTQVASTSRGLPAEELADLARGIFGADRVRVAPRLDDALELATTLADVDAGLPGVLVTGSVIAVGEARAMLVDEQPQAEEVVDHDATDEPVDLPGDDPSDDEAHDDRVDDEEGDR